MTLYGGLPIKFSVPRLHLQDTDEAKEVVNKAIEQNPRTSNSTFNARQLTLPHIRPRSSSSFDTAIAQEFKASLVSCSRSRKLSSMRTATDMKELESAQEFM